MNTSKLLVVAAIGVGVYIFAMRSANAASRPAPGASAAPTGPGGAASEANQWFALGRNLRGIGSTLQGIFRGGGEGTNYPIADETARLAARYPAPDDAVPGNPPGNTDPWGWEQYAYGSITGLGDGTGGAM